MEIKSMEDLEKVRQLIGEQNFNATKRALNDGARFRVFKSPGELEANENLLPKEKEACQKKFEEQDWASWVRPPSRIPSPEHVLGIWHDDYMDSHGNMHYGGGVRREPRH